MTVGELERLIRRDPAGRGLLSSASASELCTGNLQAAASELAEPGRTVGIVTGFFVPDADPPSAETDGLTGSVMLAATLTGLGSSVLLITDQTCASAVRAAATSAAGCRGLRVIVCPCNPAQADRWRTAFWTGDGAHVSHLIAVERPGPSYSSADLNSESSRPDIITRFTSTVPETSWGRCHNMRGRDIHESAADLNLLFEERPSGVRTVGIGDGGNEIGMGSIGWERIVEAAASEFAATFACRTPTDATIVAGVSDWGAQALAAAVCLIKSDLSPLEDWTGDRIEQVLQSVVRDGPAVDGITRRAEPTVDGLPLMTYVQPWLQIRRQLGLEGR